MNDLRRHIAELVGSIEPCDPLEEKHRSMTLEWIGSGASLFRIAKPDTPPQHLVSYFLLLDPLHRMVLLVDHIKAGLWLPSGGHVEPEEHPEQTVRREVVEELGIEATFLLPHPLFITVTETVGSTSGHTDISLWYLLRGDSTGELMFDRSEFRSIAWFPIDRLPDRTDPHMERFAGKLLTWLAEIDRTAGFGDHFISGSTSQG
jgi:8-oxo-dGTP pyrophosphatase MutT (NUDIX family)